MMDRRAFVTGSLALLAAPLAAEAQRPAKHVGILWASKRPTGSSPYRDALRQGLRELGYVEGQNIVFEDRFGDGTNESLPGLATELVHSNVDVLVATSERTTRALRQATNTVPIVFCWTHRPSRVRPRCNLRQARWQPNGPVPIRARGQR